MKVSCLCPTYNRAPDGLHLVEEALECFLRQDYPDKEFILLNDTPGQSLKFDHPQVRIVNTPFRCASLGQKRNLLAGLATGEILCTWDDDDISLPWRVSLSVKLLGDAEYFNPGVYWFLQDDILKHDHPRGVCFNGSAYRRSAFLDMGGISNVSWCEDIVAVERLRQRRVAQAGPLPLEDWFYIYRWGVSQAHLSFGVDSDHFYGEVGQRFIQNGTFDLQPHWKQDYVALTRSHLPNAARAA